MAVEQHAFKVKSALPLCHRIFTKMMTNVGQVFQINLYATGKKKKNYANLSKSQKEPKIRHSVVSNIPHPLKKYAGLDSNIGKSNI